MKKYFILNLQLFAEPANTTVTTGNDSRDENIL